MERQCSEVPRSETLLRRHFNISRRKIESDGETEYYGKELKICVSRL